MTEQRREREKQWAIALGGVAGGAAGLLANFLTFHALRRPDYPVTPTTFALVVAGAFAGTWLAERLGRRALRVMSVATGVLLALLVASWLILANTPAM